MQEFYNSEEEIRKKPETKNHKAATKQLPQSVTKEIWIRNYSQTTINLECEALAHRFIFTVSNYKL